MMESMEIWNRFDRPPADVLRVIQGGRLRGLTDIRPQWRIQAMTEVFGPCGVGWKYSITDRWTENGSEGEVCVFLALDLFVKNDGEWSAAIPGMGGDKLIAKERGGLHSNDECYKMALSDALGVAMRALGVAADVYLGQWDGTRYRQSNEPTEEVSSEMMGQVNAIKKDWLAARPAMQKRRDSSAILAEFNKWVSAAIDEPAAPESWTKEHIKLCRSKLLKEALVSGSGKEIK